MFGEACPFRLSVYVQLCSVKDLQIRFRLDPDLCWRLGLEGACKGTHVNVYKEYICPRDEVGGAIKTPPLSLLR